MAAEKYPLEGVRVVELATFIAGPCCTRFLADLGAQVIKIEGPGGDPYRKTGINEGRPTGDLENTSFDLENANKKGLCINYKTPEGREVLERLLATADVFVTNVREKSLKRHGLDYDSLKQRYPKLVVGQVSGYGEYGPDKDLPGYDFTAYFARGGIMGTMYDKDSAPMTPIAGFGDHPTGLYLSNGILAALYRARETGRGDKITVNLLHSAIWSVAVMLQSAQYGQYTACYPIPRRDIPNPLTMPYRTQDDRWLQLGVPAYDALYNRCMEALGLPELKEDPRFYPQSHLPAHLHTFYDLLVERIAQQSLGEWCKILTDADIPYAVTQTWEELLEDPQAWANDCYYKMKYPTGQERTLVRPPVHMRETPLPEYKRGPYVGEQTWELLPSLGYTREQIESMLKSGAVEQHPPREYESKSLD
ncbi:CoA transferase [Pseudoflavonifractor sp. An85]|uniref:CaiB/BaiF CoA transferase family protein n=1 Tax=Pseudoflavonifractor sp. An85 TaxID=1965661 RepID=UPI000B372663|nr:CoA transferase [Pseudoflavonifractor sp. An85]OUN24280.1 cinnamoyl-CoA:phenyllactate CoA-transferase [Pseudoflavonifractor sp. An85]